VAQRMARRFWSAQDTTPRRGDGEIVTSNDASWHVVIGLYPKMSYLATSREFPDLTPDKAMFFCGSPGGGGQTPLADMRPAYRKLPRELVQRFEAKGWFSVAQETAHPEALRF
jgi:hypothetical protein